MKSLLQLAFLPVLVACGSPQSGGRSAIVDELAGEPSPLCTVSGAPVSEELQHFVGTMHEHSSYSDGDIHSIPADYFSVIQAQGLSFAGSSEHSDTLDDGVFIAVGGDCFSTPDGLLTCLTPLRDDTLAKWEATAVQADAASNDEFLAIRGFEWTSDRFGHINVYFSHNFTNAKTDLGYLLTMESFWDWFTRAPLSPGLPGSVTSSVLLGGGGDGLAHFNHPSDKCLSADDAACNWNDFELVPAAVERMFGMELFNGGGVDAHYPDDYVRALDKGWRLAPVGSEDEHGASWGSPALAKTVTLASSLAPSAVREAWLQRRVYALRSDADLRISIQAANHPMGTTLRCDAYATVPYSATVAYADGSVFAGSLQLISNGGVILGQTSAAVLKLDLPVSADERYYFLRVNDAQGEPLAFAAPVWIATTE